jgi:hypothetical protein
VIFCADRLWRLYGGKAKYRWLAWGVGTTFMPTLFALRMGQVGPMILFGVVVFLYFEHHQHLFLAGTASVLIAIKPHLLYLFWPAFLFWAINRRNWSLLLGGLAAGLMATGIPLIFNTSVISQYLDLTTNQPPFYWATPTLGTLLRLLFGVEKHWLQFLPSVAGFFWFFLFWQSRKLYWDWREQTPLLLLVSVATSAYGWTFDQVVLLPAVIQVLTWISHGSDRIPMIMTVLVYLFFNACALTMNLMHVGETRFIWMSPTFLLGYLILRHRYVTLKTNHI